jgi:aminoglycoside phosphotransferase (APT) family kinase protein
MSLEKFTTGQSNPTFLVTTQQRRFVLRTKPGGPLLKSAHQVEREFRVLQALGSQPVAVPQVFYLARDEASPSGRAFFLMEFLQGRIFWDPALPDLARQERAAIFDRMNAALAALHSVDVASAGLADYGKASGYFARQTERWAAQYRDSAPSPLPQMTEIMAWLDRTMPPDDGTVALVHGDWRIDNIMFARSEPEIIGILDWELSTLGHPFADLAYQCMQWRLPNDGDMRGLGGVDRDAAGLPSEAEYVAAYCARRGISGIDNWSFYLVFAFFRLAAILAGVAARAEGGNASNPEMARKYGAAVPRLADMACAILREGAA